MNWNNFRNPLLSWIDTRIQFCNDVPKNGVLVDLGAYDGETLNHIAELRPDLGLVALDIEGRPERYPDNTRFCKSNIETDPIDCEDNSVDAITCMHLVEHLNTLENLFSEAYRVLKPGGRIYVETPRPKTISMDSKGGASCWMHTVNFYDDPTHTRIVSPGLSAKHMRKAGLDVYGSGVSRNWLFAASWPLLSMTPPSRKKFTAYVHFSGWSSYVVARK